jgi:alpha-glucosidase
MPSWQGALTWGLALVSSVTAVPDYNLLNSCPGYRVSNLETNDSGLKARLQLAGTACNAYGDDLRELDLIVTAETDDRLHVIVQDINQHVYQVPESVFPRPGGSSSITSNRLKFNLTEDPFAFSVSRTDTDEVIFDTSVAKMIFQDQYIRLRTRLPDDPYLYGLGEHSDPFRLKTSSYTRTLWAQDSFAIPENANLYGTQPFYIEHRPTGSHGVFLLNSNGMDVIINRTSDGQYLEYNSLGGVFDFWFFAGESPIEVTQQYAQVAGLPALSPYWGLGFHQCRYGYRDVFNLAEVVQNYSRAEIPMETLWTDIDYMDRRRTFSIDPDRFPITEMQQFLDALHERDQHYIVMVDPAVAYQDYSPRNRGVEQNAFLKRSNGSEWIGVVWPGVTVFPDWFAANASSYWTDEFARFFDEETGVDIDGLWIDMNEPSNFPCFFPCDDPYTAAIGYPPPAPALREPPRPLPGWPCSLQPPGTDCSDDEETFSRRVELKVTQAKIRSERKAAILDTPHAERGEIVTRQDPARWQGLPNRDLLYPKYSIANRAAYRTDWNDAEGGLSNKTVNTNIIHQNGLAEYDVHNLYGHMMSYASYDAMLARRPGRRPFIITRSTFAGAGTKVGHWLGDNQSNWDHYRKSIRTMLGFTSIYQIPMTGSDVCGFAGNTSEQLCARWAALGAFSPFFRSHARFDTLDQEFYRWESVANSARKAIEIRYRLLDYLYTALHKASIDGTPVLYPTFYLYVDDRNSWPLDLQYFYGPGLLVAPVTAADSTSVDVYLPNDTFYDWYTLAPICGTGATRTFSDQDTTMIPLLIRSGVILPVRTVSDYTTTALRTHDFELIIPKREDGTASGELYLDDGDSLVQEATSSITFNYADGELVVAGEFGYETTLTITKVTLLTGDCANGGSGSNRTISVEISLVEPTTVQLE